MEDKFIFAIGIFDDDTNIKFNMIKNELRLNGIDIGDIPPHITFAGYVDIDEKKLCKWVEEFSMNNRQIDIRFSNMGLFGLKTVFLSPYVSKELKEFHRRFHAKYDDMCGQIGLNYALKGNGWIPHATIITSEEETILKALPIINRMFEPFTARIKSIELYELFPVRKIGAFNLMDKLSS